MTNQIKLIILGIAAVILFVAVLLGGMPFESVPEGSSGVRIRWGKAVGVTESGLQWKTPFIESFDMVNHRMSTANEHSEAASHDLQRITTDVSVPYSLNQGKVLEGYRKVGNREAIENVLIEPAIKECFKAITARYTAEELIQKRAEASIAIQDELTTFISSNCELNGTPELSMLINIGKVSVEDFKFSVEFDESIEAKVKAEQSALQALEAKNQTVTEAEGQKEKARLESEAVAIKIENEAKAEAAKIEMVSTAKADAIKREAEALRGNPDLIILRQVEQWDGKLPKFTSGGNMGFLMEMQADEG